MTKYVYFFGGGKAEGKADMKNLLGGKGANLAEMTNIGLPVPPGFTLTTEICTYYYANNRTYPSTLKQETEAALQRMEAIVGAKYGDAKNPLLVSCRSGARVSMPGMMDTVLNIGLNDVTVQALAAQTNNERFAWDSYRRFVQMYGDVVLGLKPQDKLEIDPFEKIMEEVKHAKHITLDTELTTDDLKELVKRFKAAIKQRTGKDFPTDPMEQMWGAIGAVFGSWMNDRAIVYRRMNNISHDWGTAANIQAMVFGNMGNDCATGVCFTRNPATGDNVFYGDYLINAQGEDVVAGIRTPQSIEDLNKQMPETYRQLMEIRKTLEKHYREMQDIEFTVQRGKLYMLQTRNGKRTGFAAVRIAVDMVDEGLITSEEALMRVEPDALNQLLQPVFDVESKATAIKEGRLLARGINAGPGAATGKICLHAEDAEQLGRQGEKVILVRRETSPEDIRGMQAAQGILTAFGGASSHAALVSRQMGKVCVVGCQTIDINYEKATITVGERVLKSGEPISIDGFTGEVLSGHVSTKPSEVIQVLIDKTMKPEQSKVFQQFAKLMEWADQKRQLRIRTNADTPSQAKTAIAFGAEGIGLCRTEHMFFEGNRIDAMRAMILANTPQQREAALNQLLPYQRQDFEGIFRAMQGYPVTIRTLDPPLHEFLPHTKADQIDLADKLKITVDEVLNRVHALHEFNPMLGFRGCRLGIVYPGITRIQCRAIFEAACNVTKEGIKVVPEIMIPLVGFVNELKAQAAIVHETAQAVFAEKGIKIPYLVGTMIELPRGCQAADSIAKEAEFFSFGTNDLTQTTLGISRDDYGRFIHHYLENDIIPRDPFQTIDFEGVGGLMEMGVQKGRSVRSDLKIGICGEHGGDPDSVKFCHQIGLDYVSCSPYRVPIARLAAAQAQIKTTAKT